MGSGTITVSGPFCFLPRGGSITADEEQRERHRAYEKRYQTKHAERLAAKHKSPEFRAWVKEGIVRRRRNDPKKYKAQVMCGSARVRASKCGCAFDITYQDVLDVMGDTCPVLGCSYEMDSSRKMYNSPTLDRFVPELGYIKGNICVISSRANTMKSDGSIADVRKLLTWMETQCQVSQASPATPNSTP